MAKLTPNLKLRLSDGLTEDALYNLQRIDSSAIDAASSSPSGDKTISSAGDIYLVAGQTGGIHLQAASLDLGALRIGAANLDLTASIDNTSISTPLTYSSLNITGSIQNADLAGNITLAKLNLTGLTITPGQITGPVPYASSPGQVQPGDLAGNIPLSKLTILDNTLFGAKLIDGSVTYQKLVLTGAITPADLSGGIPYAKLSLGNSLVNSDISSSAAIARSKLANGTPGHVLINGISGEVSSESVLSVSRGGTGVISAAVFPTSGVVLTAAGAATVTGKTIDGAANTLTNIGYLSLGLGGSIRGTDISASAAIPYSKLQLAGSITNADISPAGRIAGSKLDPDFGNVWVQTDRGIQLEKSGWTTLVTAQQTGLPGETDALFSLPPNNGTSGQVLGTDGTGKTSWRSAGTGSVSSIDVQDPTGVLVSSGGPVTTSGVINLSPAPAAANTVLAGPTSGGAAAPTFRTLTKQEVGLENVDNTSDADKPVSTATQTALGAKEPTITTLPVAKGGTGGTTAATALNNLLPDQTGNAARVLTTDGVNAVWAAVPPTVLSFKTDWAAADGTTKAVTHSLNTTDVIVIVRDSAGQTVLIDSDITSSPNAVTLVSPVAPAGTWRVLILAL